VESITKKRLVKDLREIGVRSGCNLLVSSAISKVGWIEGGVNTVLESLFDAVGKEGSIFGNAFTRLYKLPLNKDDARKAFAVDTPAYSGSLINLMLKHPDSVRSSHPSCSVVGIGPNSHNILDNHNTTKPAYDAIHSLAKDEIGWMLKLGTAKVSPGSTTVHVAKDLLGFKNNSIGKLGVSYLDEDGTTKLYVKNYAGGCSQGFWKFYEHYRDGDALLEGKVGNADSILMNLKKTLEIDLKVLKKDPTFFFCDDPLCYSCRVSWSFSPESRITFKLKYLLTKQFPTTKRFFT